MAGVKLFLAFLLVCSAQTVFCCGACAGKKPKTIKINETIVRGNLSQDSSKPSGLVGTPVVTFKKNTVNNNRTVNIADYGKNNVTSSELEQKHQWDSRNGTPGRRDIARAMTTTIGVKTIPTSPTKHGIEVTTTHAQTTALPSITSTITKSLQQNINTLSTSNDSCTAWEQCPLHRHPKIQAVLHNLPACPCHFPYGLYYNNSIYDRIQGKLFAWRNVNHKLEKLGVFKPTAVHCIRQLLTNSATATATQQCCYDRRLRLITRGSGTGTPNLVAPELDETMHINVDLMPFISCQGDWTRYQAVRPPNNALKCRENPEEEEFFRQLKQAKDY